MRDMIPDAVFKEMASRGIRYDPTLVVLDSIFRIARHDVSIVEDPLVRQTIPAKLLGKMRAWIQNHEVDAALAAVPDMKNTAAVKNLISAYRAGVPLVLGTDSGNFGTFHGPAVHREMELWQDAGLPPVDILKAATSQAAQLLGAGDRIGSVIKGYEANLVIVDGNPSTTYGAPVVFPMCFSRVERIRRAALFE
jgi:imidazolonepropionase-like amidohydrolase